MSDRLPSLELVAHIITAERDALLRHVDSLDAKAGITLGFSGAFVALGNRTTSGLTVGALIAAVLAAGAAVWAFMPRPFPTLEARRFRDRYLRAEPGFTRLHTLDTSIEMIEKITLLMRAKSRRLRAALGLLVIAAAFLALDTL